MTESKRVGPKHEIVHVCEGCVFLRGNPEVQYPGYECIHQDAPTKMMPGSLMGKGYIGDKPFTPSWCPCFKEHLND